DGIGRAHIGHDLDTLGGAERQHRAHPLFEQRIETSIGVFHARLLRQRDGTLSGISATGPENRIRPPSSTNTRVATSRKPIFCSAIKSASPLPRKSLKMRMTSLTNSGDHPP